MVTAQNATISKIKIKIDNSREILRPIKVNNSESIKYTGGKLAVILNKFLFKMGEVEINSELFNTLKEKHTVVFDCTFENKEKKLRLNLKSEFLKILKKLMLRLF